MKKILTGLTVLAMCGALNFGLTNEAQAAELDSAGTLGETEIQELYGPPPPPPPPPGRRHRHHPPPPPDDGWGYPPPPPPDDGWGRRPPPPPPPGHGHRPPPRHGW